MSKAKKSKDADIVTEVNEAEPVDTWGSKRHYQEWEVKITNGQPERLKITRPLVKITDEQAEIMNEGVLSGNNTYAKMYFLP